MRSPFLHANQADSQLRAVYRDGAVDRNSTDGFVKVVNNVINLVERLPEDVFLETPPSSPTLASALASKIPLLQKPRQLLFRMNQEALGSISSENWLIRKGSMCRIWKSCRNIQSGVFGSGPRHSSFTVSQLNKLLNFQRKFLIKVESTAELPWTSSDGVFILRRTKKIMLQEEHNLTSLNNRICKYPLLLESLLKAVTGRTKRITDKINEAQRRAENNGTVKNLEGRVEDWKGHHIAHFGVHPAAGEWQEGAGPSKKKNTPLLLKGRIFLNNVTQAVPKVSAGQYSLAVWWRGDDDLEFFTLRCRNEEQLKMWENQLNRLIKETASRPRIPPHMRYAQSYAQERSSVFSQSTAHNSMPPNQSNLYSSRSIRHPYANVNDEGVAHSSSPYGPLSNGYGSGPQGYPPHEGFDMDPDDDYEDYPPASANAPPGRGTPLADTHHQHSQAAPVVFFGPPSANRPSISRNMSNASDISSFGPGVVPSRGNLRSQFSSTKLKAAYDEGRASVSPMPTPAIPLPMRSRSMSQPNTYITSQMVPPPLPTATPWVDRSQSAMAVGKRGSGSSQSTGDSSDYSPHSSSSPITPYGSSESSLAGIAGVRSMRAHGDADDIKLSSPVKVKVHFNEDIFVIQVPRTTEYSDLVEKVGKKIRLCGPQRDDGPLRVKYKDEDGDLVSLGSTEDVQMAFESFRPGSQVTLFVQTVLSSYAHIPSLISVLRPLHDRSYVCGSFPVSPVLYCGLVVRTTLLVTDPNSFIRRVVSFESTPFRFPSMVVVSPANVRWT
ncbi:Rho guanine nucleotide exchange factor scd1 [Grifola frondosa]|uniref:Rho guanine nucleotide exchange factor scd1 n=1 Tax=Grifola frondosa TaxID=5627 RepID=A0A1C7LVT5_GRIFR|nr:Rho guanine nucleotide exchange factor scd1 [Grifola frondosa]